MLGLCQVGKTSHPRDLTPGKTAATPSRCLHHNVPTPLRNAQGRTIHMHRHTSHIKNPHSPHPTHTHMHSHRFDKLSRCQQMLNLLCSLIPPTHDFTHPPPNTHMHTLGKRIQTHFIFLRPPFPRARLCSRCFNDMLWEWPTHSARAEERPRSIKPHDCLCECQCYAQIALSERQLACRSVLWAYCQRLFSCIMKQSRRKVWRGKKGEGESMRAKLRGDLIIFNQRQLDKKRPQT